MQKLVSRRVQFFDGEGTIHGFTTGTVSVKSKFRTAKGGALASKLNFLLDQSWTEAMPILVWVIDHPEGVFVIDTGENARVTKPDYFRKEGFFKNFLNTRSFRFEISPEEEIGPQLKYLGYSQKDIYKVILTHLHLDHFDGLHYFDQTEIMVHDLEIEQPEGMLPTLLPKWFDPVPVSLNRTKNSFFEGESAISQSGELKLVHTSGHTLGHCSVIVETKNRSYFLAGDVTYNEEQLKKSVQAGANMHFRKAKRTFDQIKNYAAQHPMVYLPSHDIASLDRLDKAIIFKN